MAKPEELIPQVCAWGAAAVTATGVTGLIFPALLPISAGLAGTLATIGCVSQAITQPVVKKKKNSYRDHRF